MKLTADQSDSSPPRQPLAPLPRWLVAGSLAGAVFGAMYGWLGLLLANAEISVVVLVSTAGLGAVAGVGFSAWHRTRRPTECVLATWLGVLLGLIPAIVMLAHGAGGLDVISRPIGLAGLVAGPVAAGLLVGGFLDRLFEPVLFPPGSNTAQEQRGAESHAPRWRRWLTRIGFLAALLCGVGFCQKASSPHNRILVDRLEADLRDNVPPGSTRAQAETWFKARGLKFAVISDGSPERPVGYSSRVDNDSWLESAEIRIVVEFDDTGRVTNTIIRRFVSRDG